MKKVVILFLILGIALGFVYLRYKSNDSSREGTFNNFLIKANKEFLNYNMTSSELDEYNKLIDSSYEIMESKKFNEAKAIEEDFSLLNNKVKSENVIYIYKQTQILNDEIQEIKENPKIKENENEIKKLIDKEKYVDVDKHLDKLNIEILKERKKESKNSINEKLIKVIEAINKKDLKKAQNILNSVDYANLDSFNKEEYSYLETILKEKFIEKQEDITH